MRIAGLVLLVALSSLSLAAREQEQRPSFRAGVDLIQLAVSALDEKRQPVRGLTEADFTVLENGKPRPIRAFSAIDLPARDRSAETVWAGTIPPDVTTNAIGERDGRLVIILMDRSIHVGENVVKAKTIATAAVETLGPNDLGALISTSGGVPQNLTADRARLIKAINQRDWSTDGSDSNINPPFTLSSPLQDGRCLCGVCVLDTITRVSDAVRDTPRRRKVLLFIGSGALLQVGGLRVAGDVGCAQNLRHARKAMFDSLAVSNLTIHSIDPTGLANLGPQTQGNVGGARGGDNYAGPRQRLAMQQTSINDQMALHGTLRALAEETGGRAVMNTNAPQEKIPEIFRESEVYYVIGFEAETAGPNDNRRSIEVKTGRKGVRVYAQRQYVVPAALQPSGSSGPSATRVSLDTALAGLLPAAGAPLTLAVSAFAKDGEKASVNINVDAGAFSRDDSSVPLEVRVSALDQAGHQMGTAQQTSTIPAHRNAGDRLPVVNVQTFLDLAPNDYEIRVAVADTTRERVASVFAPLLIPAFADAPLSLSSVAIEMAASSVSSPTDPSTAPVIPTTPTTQRSFARTDRVRAFFQIYQGTQRTDPVVPVTVRVRVIDARGNAIRDQSLVFADTEFRRRRADCRLNLPIQNLPAGDYVVNIEGTAGNQTAGRAVRFSVY